MKRLAYILFVVLAAWSCVEEDGRIATVEIGAMEENVTLECTQGEYVMEVLANGDYTATVSQGDWLSFEGGSMVHHGSSDEDLVLSYEMNRGAKRTAEVVLSREGRQAVISFTQKGIIEVGLAFTGHNVNVAAEGGLQSAGMETLMQNDELSYEIIYSGVSGWISDVVKENNALLFNALQNTTAEGRRAVIKVVSRVDGTLSDELHVAQAGTGDEYSHITFQSLFAIASEENKVDITSDLLLSGRVINDNSEGNGAENLNISADLQDLDRASRVVYVQNDDASAGVLVEFNTASDNTTRRFDGIVLNLKGMTLTKYPATDKEPLRYELTGAGVDNIFETKGGSVYDLPVKEKRISQLSDSDLYTYVTLTDCEIPFRKGPFVPVDLRYDVVMNKYPMPLRDIDGGNTYLLSNTSCAWARDGKGLPEGSGNVSGVVVHEKCDNFAWDNQEASRKLAAGLDPVYITGVGTISRYQIRPIVRREIDIKENFEDGFSDMLMEIRYVNKTHDALVKNVDDNWSLYSTWPQTPYPMLESEVSGVMRRIRNGKQEAFGLWRDWSHLGPVEGGRITDPAGGNGVEDYDGNSAHWSVYSLVNVSGLIIDENGSGWYTTKWNDDQYIKVEFSTEGLIAANFPLSVSFGAINGLGESVGAPRYWQLEWSVDNTKWTKFAEYTVPDFPIVYKKRPWQCPGYKMMTFNLPENPSLLGTKVYVRLKAANTQAGTMESYDAGTVASSMQSALNYFAVRYNK